MEIPLYAFITIYLYFKGIDILFSYFNLQNKPTNLHQQLQSILSPLSCISIYFMLLVILNIRQRIIGKEYNPLQIEKPKSIQLVAINNIIQNSIESLFIFLPLYLKWSLKQQESRNILAMGYLYLIARILFAIGYYSGTFKLKYARQRRFGFALSFHICILLILDFFQVPLIQYIV
uniref:Ribosomal protein L11 n=1 Tax=Cryptocaryon irritans TaxID=153251 RepID=R9QVR2_9CILI|nr:ribosomal protein L11 [Cryptocaryon irritans]